MADAKKTKKPSLKIKKGLVFRDKDPRMAERRVQVVKKDSTKQGAWWCYNEATARQTSISEKSLREKFTLVEPTAAEQYTAQP